MRKTTRRPIAELVVAGLVGVGSPAVADATNAQNLPHVRSNNSSLVALITRATEQSTTFRGLIDAINVGDGIVYVEPGHCRYSRACVVGVTAAGGYRILRVSVVLRHADSDLMAFIGHELQHAIEILSNPHVRNTEDIYLFYSRFGTRGKGPLDFETTAATKAGDAVRKEIRAFKSCMNGRASGEERIASLLRLSHYYGAPKYCHAVPRKYRIATLGARSSS